MGSTATMSIFCAAGCRAATGQGAQAVQGRLQNDRAHGDDRHLEAHGQADAHGFPDILEPSFQSLAWRPQQGLLVEDVAHAEQTRYHLGQHCGPGRARHTHFKVKDEDEIQNNIQEAGDDQEKQRGLAVAQGHDHVGEQIEKHGRADAPRK